MKHFNHIEFHNFSGFYFFFTATCVIPGLNYFDFMRESCIKKKGDTEKSIYILVLTHTDCLNNLREVGPDHPLCLLPI